MQRPDLHANEALRGLKACIAQIDEVTAKIAAWASQRTGDEVTALCQNHHMPCARLRDVLEVLEDPHLHARGFLMHRPTAPGSVVLLNSPIRYRDSTLRPLTPTPSLRQHTQQRACAKHLPAPGWQPLPSFERHTPNAIARIR